VSAVPHHADSARPARLGLLGAVVCALASPAFGLLNIDGTRNQVFVFGNVSFGYNSNIFAEAGGEGDYTRSAQLGVELKRRAGIIAVNATAKFDYLTYDRYTGENTLNPSVSVELNKTTGRTTGSLAVSAYRETRSDSAVNLRTSTWNFPVNLNLRYPVNDHLYLTSATGYLRRTYDDDSGLVDYRDYTEAIDVFYVYTSKLDLLGGYRLRVGQTSLGRRTADHWFNVGATGGILAKLSGTIRLGYQLRTTSGSPAADDDFAQFNAAASLNWPLTRKLFLSTSLMRDFNTIATGASVDSTSAALNAAYTYNRKLEFSATAAVGRNKFLGRDQLARADTFVSYGLNGRYSMSEHLQFSAAYTYFRNWSSINFADYDSHLFSVDVTSRY
jgi:hypothetical protein